jgi:spore germination cell wall hydrolase CwlJ-like protein
MKLKNLYQPLKYGLAAATLTAIIIVNPSLASIRATEDISFAQSETYCLAQVIYFEARGEPLAGQLAVAQVTINRRDSKLFPDTLCGVVAQQKPCQYSWYCDSKSDRLPNNSSGAKALALAANILTTKPKDITQGALFFHASSINPGWHNLEKTVEIGAHVFYRRS